MKKIEIYTSPLCGYCHAAKRLLNGKGVNFVEYDVSRDPERRREMVERSGGRHTVPQTFINGVHVGGCDELHELEHANKLDPMLTA